MVHLDKVEGQTGSMVLHEDGSIISSTGDLASSEQTAQAIVNLITHSLQVDFTSTSANSQSNNGCVNQGAVGDNNGRISGGGEGLLGYCKWNRITVSFGDHSYVACLSNKRINVIKKDGGGNKNEAVAVAAAATEVDIITTGATDHYHQNNEQ